MARPLFERPSTNWKKAINPKENQCFSMRSLINQSKTNVFSPWGFQNLRKTMLFNFCTEYKKYKQINKYKTDDPRSSPSTILVVPRLPRPPQEIRCSGTHQGSPGRPSAPGVIKNPQTGRRAREVVAGVFAKISEKKLKLWEIDQNRLLDRF